MQASRFERLLFDPFALFQNGLVAAEVDVGGCDVVDALVIALVIVMVDERFDLSSKKPGKTLYRHDGSKSFPTERPWMISH